MQSGDGKAIIEIYDGLGSNDNLLASVDILNNTRPQSITTTGHNLFIKITADAKMDIFATIKIISSPRMYI